MGHVMDEQAVFDALKYRVEITRGGTRRYYNNAGHLHRTEGPAVERANGYKAWYQNGIALTALQLCSQMVAKSGGLMAKNCLKPSSTNW